MDLLIDNQTVGLIVRGKQGEEHEPNLMDQHADCILPKGAPVGYFGGPGDGSSGNNLSQPFASLNKSGMNMKGFVAYYNDFNQIRPMYINIKQAEVYGIISTVLIFQVTKQQADAFENYWMRLKINPKTFNLVGGNCSSRAAEAFVTADILENGIDGLDTPNNLYKQLRKK